MNKIKKYFNKNNLSVIFNKDNFGYKYFSNFFCLINKQIFRSSRTYIFCIICPLFFSLFLNYSWQLFYKESILTPPLIIGFLSCGYIFIGAYLAFNIYELKNKNFFSRVKVFGVSKNSIIISYFLNALILFFISFSINIASLILYSCVKNNYESPFVFCTLNNLTWFVWVEIIISLIFLNFISVLYFGFFFLLIKNKKIVYSLFAFNFIFSLIFSEIFVAPSVMASSNLLLFISYFSIFKYCSWLLFIVSSYMNFDFLGYSQIFIDNYNNVFISFKNIYQVLSPLIIFWNILFFVTIFKMKFSNRY